MSAPPKGKESTIKQPEKQQKQMVKKATGKASKVNRKRSNNGIVKRGETNAGKRRDGIHGSKIAKTQKAHNMDSSPQTHTKKTGKFPTTDKHQPHSQLHRQTSWPNPTPKCQRKLGHLKIQTVT